MKTVNLDKFEILDAGRMEDELHHILGKVVSSDALTQKEKYAIVVSIVGEPKLIKRSLSDNQWLKRVINDTHARVALRGLFSCGDDWVAGSSGYSTHLVKREAVAYGEADTAETRKLGIVIMDTILKARDSSSNRKQFLQTRVIYHSGRICRLLTWDDGSQTLIGEQEWINALNGKSPTTYRYYQLSGKDALVLTSLDDRYMVILMPIVQ